MCRDIKNLGSWSCQSKSLSWPFGCFDSSANLVHAQSFIEEGVYFINILPQAFLHESVELNWIVFISDLVSSFVQNTNKEFWKVGQYTTIGLIKHKHYFIFKEAEDNLELHFFYRVSWRHFFPQPSSPFFIIFVTDLNRFEKLFKPHL